MVRLGKAVCLLFAAGVLLVSCDYTEDGSGGGVSSGNNKLKIVRFSPSLPSLIPVGERLTVTVEYNIRSAKEAQIFIRPFTNGRRTPGIFSHGCRSIQSGKGTLEGYFFFDDPTVVDEIQIEMVNVKDQLQVYASVSKEISAEWVDNPLR
jgi:hypothetical protein